MEFDVYRSVNGKSQFHLHDVGSRCPGCASSPIQKNLEMPEEVYKVLGDKLRERGCVLMPQDMANSELVTNWWLLVSLFLN